MAIQKPSIPRGTRDFSPGEMVKRNFIFDTIRQVFHLHGYLPIETPSMENLETLMGKYGEEGDKLIFKILNSGDFLSQSPIPNPQSPTPNPQSPIDYRKFIPKIAEKALRYDLTVPFARYVVMHQHDIAFPFKRYQIQPVWRADRPQKGRYREFYQCDADVIGSNSLLNEVELIQMIDKAFTNLKIPVTVKINNRKILYGISEVLGEKERITDITVALDKIDKIGITGVNEELKEKNISEAAIAKLQPLFELKGDTAIRIGFLKHFLSGSAIGNHGIEEIEQVLSLSSNFKLQTSSLELDLTLARGLNYYTGAILEVKANTGTLTSSICAGGRYDDLTGIFGLPNVSGVGISFGADRIYDVMEEMKLFPDFIGSTTKILFVNFGKEEEKFCLPLLVKVREAGINAELYPDHAKIKKQFEYADKKQIPYVIVAGAEEMRSGQLTLKDMKSGTQQTINIESIIQLLTPNP